MERETDEADVAKALRSEVAGWEPRWVPNLADLSGLAERHWRRPVFMASAVGAVALAVMLVVSVVLVALAPGIPGGEAIRAHLIGP